MVKPNADFVMSTEEECLTAVEGTDDPEKTARAMGNFLGLMATLAPSIPCPAHGFFNPYGRVYVDTGGHVELAAIESSCPYFLALVTERQHHLVKRAIEKLAEDGCSLVLANNNHSGLFQQGAAIWGAHENFLVERHPSQFAAEILPFLVTRIYAGAGGVQLPTGNFLAGVRPEYMKLATGGGTTDDRAIHSTCREEHHQGPEAKRFRYHLILGDGHRSQFNLALQFGATALALKAISFDARLRSDLEKLRKPPFHDCWVRTIRELNLLAKPGEDPRAHPLVLEIQRLYLAGAHRYAESLDGESPSWVPRLLKDWGDTLDALERGDRRWLSGRLDAFAKYEFYSAYLAEAGRGWKDLSKREELFFELALLDQSYHEFCSSGSVFTRLEQAGLLFHRVGTPILPGKEEEPYVPETATRARARARFIVENAGADPLIMDWPCVMDIRRGKLKELWDPFAQAYGPWRPCRDAFFVLGG